jgi:hypothetical protein
MMQRNIQRARASSSLTRWAHPAILPLGMSMLACSGNPVIMGEDGIDSAPVPSSSRCFENSTLEGDVVVRNQEELAALEGCKRVSGDLTVVAFQGADLRPLHALTAVDGTLDLWGSTEALELQDLSQDWLASLDGLESLERVGGLEVLGLMADNVAPLARLEVLTGSGRLLFGLCPNLVDLGGLGGLIGIRALSLSCSVLESIEALTLPEEMDSIEFTDTPLTQLTDVSVHTLFDGLSLTKTALTNLDAFASLVNAGAVSIVSNLALENLNGLNGLTSAGSLGISHNRLLTRLPEFPELATLDELMISDNPRLTTLADFPTLHAYVYSILDEAHFEDNPENLLGLRPYRIDISRNQVLTTLSLPAGWLTGAAVVIDNNRALTQIDFTQQRSIDYLSIQNNPLLETVNTGALATVNTLEVVNNPRLGTAVFDSLRTFDTRLARNAAAP